MNNSFSRGKYFSFCAAAPSLQVFAPKTDIYLDFGIKNAGLFWQPKYATSQFLRTISTVLRNYSVVELTFVQRN